ncbi:MAG TPA: type II toxin-antitoxin system PemK/MazF family toxin [Acidimicrobiales bacterium]|jgi:mRNA interferase MazF|nr:type II toxin-antitoxin system PemK/MazF family toxin [Acidimicrobiales bacterium]
MDSTDTRRRREVWLVTLGAGRTGEPAKTRPAIVVSRDELSIRSPSDLVVIVPLSSSLAPSGIRVEVPPITGIDRPSLAICRAVRAAAAPRFVRRIGTVDPATMEKVETALALILGLDHQSAPG